MIQDTEMVDRMFHSRPYHKISHCMNVYFRSMYINNTCIRNILFRGISIIFFVELLNKVLSFQQKI